MWSITLSGAGAATAALAIVAAPVASAEPRDGFLDELATLNIVLPGTTIADTVGAGYHACDLLRSGTTVLDAIDAAEHDYMLPPGQGALIVSAATTNLCPDFAG